MTVFLIVVPVVVVVALSSHFGVESDIARLGE